MAESLVKDTIAKFKAVQAEQTAKLPPRPQRSWDDTGNAERFIDQYGGQVKYIATDDVFMIYNGSYWEEDTTGKIKRMINTVVNNMWGETPMMDPTFNPKEEDEAKKRWQKFVAKSRQHSAKVAMEKEIQPLVPARRSDFDSDPMLINVKNGYVDLKTGELYPHDKSKMFSHMLNARFDKDYTAPRWLQFIKEVFGGDKEVIEYIQKAVGYTFIGSNREKVFFALFGDGNNGKTVFLNTLKELFGSYAKTMQATTLKVRRNESGATPEIARLDGARVVTASESGERMRLDEGLVKQLTGGDPITARQLYGQDFEFIPQFEIWLATNYKPLIKGTDKAIWNRIKFIPLTVTFSGKRLDPNLSKKLKSELDGILSWAIEGLMKYWDEGLEIPSTIASTNEEYRQDMDVLGQFIEDCCSVGEDATAKASDLYARYKAWSETNGQRALPANTFGIAMKERFTYKRTKSERLYLGIKLTR